MKDKPQKKKIVSINARSRAVARNFNGRICKLENRVYIVEGKPDAEILFDCLVRIKELPQDGTEPTPQQLGFAGSDIREVLPEELNNWNQALVRWQTTAYQMSGRKRQKREDKTKVEKWLQELEQLEKRRELVQSLTDSKNKHRGNEWIPAHGEETDVDALFNKVAPGMKLPPTWKYLAKLCDWIGDKNSAKRLIQTFTHALKVTQEREIDRIINSLEVLRDNYSEIAFTRYNTKGFTEEIQSLSDKITQTKKRLLMKKNLDYGINLQNHFAYYNEKLNEYTEAFNKHKWFIDSAYTLYKQLPDVYIEKLDVKLPAVDQITIESFNGFLETLKCKRSAEKEINHVMLIWVTVLTSLDKSDIPLPTELLFTKQKSKDAKEMLLAVLNYAGQPQYSELINIISHLGQNNYINDNFIKPAYNMLSLGTSSEDIIWLFDFKSPFYFFHFGEKLLSPSGVKSVAETLKSFGANITKGEIAHLLSQIMLVGNTRSVDIFASWLNKIPKLHWDADKANTAWKTLLSAVSLGNLEPDNFSQIYLWAFPPKIQLNLEIPEHFSDDTRKSLKRVLHYQKMLGMSGELPGSISELVNPAEKVKKELEGLQKLQTEGKLNESAAIRLEKLINQLQHPEELPLPNEKKVKRKADEVSAILALDALRKLTKEKQEEYFTKEYGFKQPAWLTFHELISIISFSKNLDKKHKMKFDELVRIWGERCGQFKSYLPDNQKWFASAKSRGMNTNAWLFPDAVECEKDGKKIVIGTAEDPFRIFLMGSYFDTCLSIKKEGSNRLTVLSNGYDANKQVIYAIDEKGVVLARKLIAINTNWEMIGFRTYINEKDTHELLINEINDFCRDWAEKTGVTAGIKGKPECISGLEWYDDGIETFDFTTSRQVSGPINPEIKQISENYKQEWTELLDRIGLWPPPEGTDVDSILEKCPALLEEALAFVAREKNDGELAELLSQHAKTRSGQLEAALANFVVNEREIPEIFLDSFKPDYASRVGDTLANKDSKLSAKHLTQRAFKYSVNDKYILCSLLDNSYNTAYYINNFVIQEKYWEAIDKELFIIMHLMKQHKNKLSDVFIHEMFTHIHQEGPGSFLCYLTKYALVQWMRPYSNPEKILSPDILLHYYEEKPVDEFNIRRSQVSVIIWAMRNPCSASTRFLKVVAEKDTAALLALSIIQTGRFKDFILKQAVKKLPDYAALFAIINTLKEEAPHFLEENDCFDKLLEKKDFDEKKEIFDKMNDARWNHVFSAINFKNKTINMLPYAIFALHKALDQYPNGSIGVLFSGSEKYDEDWYDLSIFCNSGVDISGLCVLLADRLKKSDDNDEQYLLKKTIHYVLNESPSFDSTAEFRLWLNRISNHRLYDNVSHNFVNKEMAFDDYGLANPYDFFFDENNKPRTTTQLDWRVINDYCSPVNLPCNPEKAKIYADFVLTKDYYNYEEEIKAPIEIHRRLFKNARERLRGKDNPK